MWDSACDAIEAECKRVQPLLDKWYHRGASNLVQHASYRGPGYAVPGFVVDLLAMKLDFDRNSKDATVRAAKWISENCRYDATELEEKQP